MTYDAADSQTGVDALELLTQGHLEIRDLFDAYQRATSTASKARLALKVCSALEVHMSIEEEIFYPAFQAALHDQAIVPESEAEHASIKDLIVQLREWTAGQAGTEAFDARVQILGQLVEHHVREEESEMFPTARRCAKLDLTELGAQMNSLKSELEDLAPA